MATKLTLSVNEEKVKKAKRFSKRTGRSVSKLFEEFIDEIDKKEQKEDFDITKIIGAFGPTRKHFDPDKTKWIYLKEKHGL